MKKTLFLLAILLPVSLLAQDQLLHNDRVEARHNPTTFNPNWAPFYHGVASGDPLEDRVIIWTRVTPAEMDNMPVEVDWFVATDASMSNIVQNGTFTTGPERDYTVKVDVTGLASGTTYYYAFSANGANSLIGKTKTTPTADEASHLKFGVVSCSNFQAGYFNAYKRLSERTDLDAIIHLGDYIYEYADGGYGDSTLTANRPLEPSTEIVTLEEYRARYSTYRLDTALARAHQQHPFIAVWDDHESANDAYTDGAQNHTEGDEGSWTDRKSVAKQVYFEWMPIRENADESIYRTIRYGNLMDLIMLDTRLEGREEQILDVESPALYDPERTLLGEAQRAWFLEQLSTSAAKWKVIGQQVIFSELNVGWAALLDPAGATYQQLESTFLDIWDGYPAERATIIEHISTNDIDNVVILTGDFHSTFAFDVTGMPVDLQFQDIPNIGTVPFYNTSGTYDPANGAGSVAVEFATPSVTSANFDENVGAPTAAVFEGQINTPIAAGPLQLGNPNPHMKYTDLIQHGYFVLDIKEEQAQADWFFTDISQIVEEEAFGEGWLTLDTENHLQAAAGPAEPKAVQDIPAPNDPPAILSNVEETINRADQEFVVLSAHPNPFRDINTLHYALSQKAQVHIALHDATGKQVRQLLHQEMQPGVFSLQLDASGLQAGTYFYQIAVNGQQQTVKVILK